MSNLHLIDQRHWQEIAIRKGFGQGLVQAADANPKVVALSADLTSSTQVEAFAEKYPERFVQVGVAEQNLVTVASGMARMSFLPFAASYASFSPGRNWEQIRTTIALNNQPVKIVGSHAGLYTGADGATHQMLEDVAMMRVMPNMVVIVPGDAEEARKATLALTDDPRPAYLRLARDATPQISSPQTPFQIGKAYIYSPGSDVTIISNGTMTAVALQAAERLFKDGIEAEVVHCPTVKPLDTATILRSVQKTKKVITIEEAQVAGGLGGAVTEYLSEHFPVPVKILGVQDQYGQSGEPQELLKEYGLTVEHLMFAAHQLVEID